MGAPRLELGTSALSGPRSNQLSYAPGPLQAAYSKLHRPTAEGVQMHIWQRVFAIIPRPQTLPHANDRYFDSSPRLAFKELPLIRI